MKGYVGNIEKATLENTNFRRVLYTAKNSQLEWGQLAGSSDAR